MTNINKDNVEIINSINKANKKEMISTPMLGFLAVTSTVLFISLAYLWFSLIP